jgi:hypothetical protein
LGSSNGNYWGLEIVHKCRRWAQIMLGGRLFHASLAYDWGRLLGRLRRHFLTLPGLLASFCILSCGNHQGSRVILPRSGISSKCLWSFSPLANLFLPRPLTNVLGILVRRISAPAFLSSRQNANMPSLHWKVLEDSISPLRLKSATSKHPGNGPCRSRPVLSARRWLLNCVIAFQNADCALAVDE